MCASCLSGICLSLPIGERVRTRHAVRAVSGTYPRKLGSVIYRAVAVTLLDWLLEAGPVLLVDVDEGALLHSFGPEPAHEETATVSRAKAQERGGGGRELKRQVALSVPYAEEALAESRRLQVEAIEALECVACTA